MNTPNTMTRAEFAAHLGVRRSYITKLGHAGRLVLTEDGKRVIVEATKERIQDTRDPNRKDVVDRNAAQRRGEPLPENEGDDIAVPGQRITHAEAKAAKEFYLAENARLDYEERCGKLLERNQVRMSIADAAATLRAALEALPPRLAPGLAGKDETYIQAVLTEHIELALTELAHKFSRAAGGMES